MSKPFREVIFYNKIGKAEDQTWDLVTLTDTNGVQFGSDTSKVYKLWGGSVQDFINDFDLPQDLKNFSISPTTNVSAVESVVNGYHNTINFKVNLEFWFRLGSSQPRDDRYAPCSNITFHITLPNFLVYHQTLTHYHDNSDYAVYNPNLFPVFISNSSWGNATTKTESIYNGSTWGGLGGSVPFLVFRYNVDNQDIQICLASLSGNVWDQNGQKLYLGRASLTFTGFNNVKKVNRV